MTGGAKSISDGEIVLATVDYAAPPDRVFDALNADEVERWWGSPETYVMRKWRSDVRVGGLWSVEVCPAGGDVLPAGGEYLSVHAPHRVSLTRQYRWDHPTLGQRVTRISYRFDGTDAGTRVTVRQDDFASEEAAHEHAAGWARVLDWLAAWLE